MVFSKKETLITKGVGIIFLYLHHLFSDSSIYSGFTVNFYPFTEQEVFTFSIFSKICVAIFVFLSGYGNARSKANTKREIRTKTQNVKGSLRKLLSLSFDYWFIFILLQITSFLGRSQIEVYGTGAKAILYFIIDFFGLASLYNTPTFNPTWWYMTLAFIIIIIMPLLLNAYRIYGVLLVFMSIFIPRLLLLDLGMIFWYLPALVLGIWCANENILERIKALSIVPLYIGNKIIKLIMTITILIWLYFLRNNFSGWVELWDAIIAFLITYFCFEFLSHIPILCYLLEQMGKHSMNMFLTHTFIFYFYFRSFTFSFSHFILILVVLVADTLILSIFIEKIKELTRFNTLKNTVITRFL